MLENVFVHSETVLIFLLGLKPALLLPLPVKELCLSHSEEIICNNTDHPDDNHTSNNDLYLSQIICKHNQIS